MFIHRSTTRVLYADTDQMGFVYYGNYPRYYEIGRVEAMRSLGLKYSDLESKFGIFMPVLSMDIRYIRPALYDEELNLETRIAKIPDDKIVFRTDIYNEKDDLVNSGTVRLFFMDKASGQRISTPSIILEKLLPYFES